MKKEYIKPEMEMFKVEINQEMLVGSGDKQESLNFDTEQEVTKGLSFDEGYRLF